MWGSILNLLSGIVNLIPKFRKWGVTSAAGKKADADKRTIDDAIANGVQNPKRSGTERKR